MKLNPVNQAGPQAHSAQNGPFDVRRWMSRPQAEATLFLQHSAKFCPSLSFYGRTERRRCRKRRVLVVEAAVGEEEVIEFPEEELEALRLRGGGWEGRLPVPAQAGSDGGLACPSWRHDRSGQ